LDAISYDGREAVPVDDLADLDARPQVAARTVQENDGSLIPLI